MIDSSVLNPSQRIADHFTASGKSLAFRSDSPFGDLVSALAVMDHRAEDYMSQIVNAAIPLNKDDMDIHTQRKDDLAERIHQVVNNMMNYTKNFINVNIREILEEVEKIKDLQEADDVSAGIQIIPLKANKLIESDTLDMLLSNVVGNGELGRALKTLNYTRVWEAPTPSEIIATLKTPSEQFNKDLMDFISGYYPEGSIKRVNFQDAPKVVNASSTFENNDDIIAYLFLHGLYRGQHPTVAFDDLDKEEQRSVKSLINYWGSRVLNRIERIGNLNKSDKVIVEAHPEENKLYVLFTNYKKWLEEGGSSDALAGYWISTGKSTRELSANIALVQKDQFETVFKREQRAAMTRTQIKVNAAAERVIYESVVKLAKEQIEDETRRKDACARAAKFYKKMNIASFDSIDDYCRFMVCKVVDTDSDSLEILNSISLYRKQNPDASMDEAVFNAISMRIVEAVFSQITVLDESVNLYKSQDM